jgi:signal transduction histidine kinase
MAEGSLRRRLRPIVAGVRFRTTMVAVVAVAAVLSVAVLVVGLAASARLESSITASVETRADDVSALAAAGGARGVLSGREGDLFAQVIDESGSVVAFSPGIEEFPPLVRDWPAVGEQRTLQLDEVFEAYETDEVEDEGPYVVVVRGVAAPSGPVTVIVGASLEPADRARDVIEALLWAGLPLVLVVMGVLVWRLVGRALRPVEAMRDEAASISASVLDRRLPEPVSQDELHRLATTLNAMLNRLEASAERQRRFVADASHELKTPVAAIRTMLEVAQREPEFADWKTLLTDLSRENRRSEELVHDLLALARADEGGRPQRSMEVDVDQIVGRQAEGLRGQAGVSIDASELTPVRVVGDPEALTRLVRNLLDNASRHAATGVWVRTRSEGDWTILVVSDDGPGIPPVDRERIFERFVRLDEARSRDIGGTGLGLAVARAVARSHGGDVTVVAPQHGGATFEVRIPSHSTA